jgi:mono/diheme cytochrome c family protein
VVAAVVLLAALGVRVLFADPQAQPAANTSVDFRRDIQPILQTSCFKCHGPTRARGGLRLDDRSAAMRGGDSGPILLAGRSGESLIVRRILGLDGEDPMPKEDPLTAAQMR